MFLRLSYVRRCLSVDVRDYLNEVLIEIIHCEHDLFISCDTSNIFQSQPLNLNEIMLRNVHTDRHCQSRDRLKNDQIRRNSIIRSTFVR